MPIAGKARGEVREKDEMRFEDPQEQQDGEIDDAENDQEATETEAR